MKSPLISAAKRNTNREKTIVYENSDHYVLALLNGAFEVYRNTSTHAVRVAQVGYKGQKGLLRAIAEADKRAV